MATNPLNLENRGIGQFIRERVDLLSDRRTKDLAEEAYALAQREGRDVGTPLGFRTYVSHVRAVARRRRDRKLRKMGIDLSNHSGLCGSALRDFIDRHMDVSDISNDREAERLAKMASSQGQPIGVKRATLVQYVCDARRRKRKEAPNPKHIATQPVETSANNESLAQIDRILRDAATAIELAREELARVGTQITSVERVRSLLDAFKEVQ